MSQHIHSMLDHLGLGPLKKSTKGIVDSENGAAVGNGNGCDATDKVSVVINDQRTNDHEVNFDSKKRYSISAPNGSSENGECKHRSRELSPAMPRGSQRKMSQDLRFKGSSSQIYDEAELALIRRPTKLKDTTTMFETYDSLHSEAVDGPHVKLACNRSVCMGSVMYNGNFPLIPVEPRKPDIVLEHAKSFLDQYFTSIRKPKSAAFDARLKQVEADIDATKGYQLTETELIYGAKLAWRNAARCIGRIQWSKLQVFDCRYVTTTSGMFEALCNHLKYATNKGNLRSAITIFPQRTDGKHDYRIWNPQMLSYAGYRLADGTVIGDPQNAEFTEVCIKLGWKSKMTPWDILPWVLSANGHDPDYFDIPDELVMQVPLTHPTYTWFSDLQLRWYVVPAVANMQFDCGGLQFTGSAFSGWYMSTEIGCRNLSDVNRRNILESVALKMNLDTRNSTTLWKDKALVEINLAVLHSFQKANVTIVDHHTASESFMKHLENETKLRHGVPADWIWIVPPMSASITPVFHQEMACYLLKPSFEYQEMAHRTHVWQKDRDKSKARKPRRKFNFKQIARAVKFTSKLFGRALSRRIKATVLYATETGKSEQFAKQLVELLGHAFNAQVYCMADYDISSIEHEALLIVIASTFGNGDAPENGEEFAKGLYDMKMRESEEVTTDDKKCVVSKSFMKATSRPVIDRATQLSGSTTETFTDAAFGPLSNVRFAVFALGSSAYPNFCSFGKYMDTMLGDLGGERLIRVAFGDEMGGQEHTFHKWAPEVFKIACETFCLDTDESFSDASLALQGESLTLDTVRMIPIVENSSLEKQLSKYHNKNSFACKLKNNPTNLHQNSTGTERSTILLEIIAKDVDYEPGDHIGIFPANNKAIVDGILERLSGVDNADEILQLQVLKETHSTNGISKNWEPHERLPNCSVRTLLTRFMDITTPASRQLLTLLSGFCSNKEDEDRLKRLADDPSEYEDWRHWRIPHLLEVLQEFTSCRPPASLLLAHLVPLQPRFYSVSSAPRLVKSEIHLTVAVVTYNTENGNGPQHFGVCSHYMEGLKENNDIYLFVRSAPSFHLPNDTKPIILIGPGTGIAPFRSFWQHWSALKYENPDSFIPRVSLFFGCREKSLDLYADEKQGLLDKGILDKVFLALSRDKSTPKTYVQDLVAKMSADIYNHIVRQEGHVYICGDVTMAENVLQTLKKIIMDHESKSEAEVEKFMLTLRDQGRYHEDIFGITLRTAEIHTKSRATARSRMESEP